jgi:hypothetical protein
MQHSIKQISSLPIWLPVLWSYYNRQILTSFERRNVKIEAQSTTCHCRRAAIEIHCVVKSTDYTTSLKCVQYFSSSWCGMAPSCKPQFTWVRLQSIIYAVMWWYFGKKNTHSWEVKLNRSRSNLGLKKPSPVIFKRYILYIGRAGSKLFTAPSSMINLRSSKVRK